MHIKRSVGREFTEAIPDYHRRNGVFMKNIHKILFLTAALSCLTILPGTKSSARDFLLQDFQEQNSGTSGTTIPDSEFMLNPVTSPSLKGEEFNDKVSLQYDKEILQGNSHILEIQDLEKNCDVSIKSSDTDVLTVEQLSNTSCSYTGVGYGSAKITVTITKTTAFFFKDRKTIHANIHVTPKAVSIMFRRGTKKIALGNKNKKLPFTIRPSISKEVPAFKSLNKKIVSVNKRGKITARRLGTTYITATLLNGKSARCKIIVLDEVQDDDEDEED